MGAYLSVEAEADLERIFQHIFAQSPANAADFLDRVDGALAKITLAPTARKLRNDELPVAGLRFAYADPAVLVYRVPPNADIEVVRIAHKHQDLPTLFASLDIEE